MSHWIKDAEAALAGKVSAVDPGIGEAVDPTKGEGSSEVDVVPVVRPKVLDAATTRAVVAPFLAAFFAGVAYFQEQRTGQPFDPIAIIMRVLALAMLVRTVVLGRELWQRLRVQWASNRYALALTPDGLLLRRPDTDVVVPREDVLAIKERGEWGGRSGQRWNEVYVVTRPASGRTFLTLPPVFDRTTGVLAERLMRWRGPVATNEEHEPPPPSELPSKVFDRAAEGEVIPGVTVIRHGGAWLRRAPYGTLLLGLAILDGFLRLPDPVREKVGAVFPGLIIFSLLVVPVMWALMVRYDIAPRKGLSLVLTPAEMLMRTRQGVHVVRWKNLERLSVETKRRWSLLRGAHEVRSVIIARSDGDAITYAEAFLGIPAEVAIALCNAHRKGQISA